LAHLLLPPLTILECNLEVQNVIRWRPNAVQGNVLALQATQLEIPSAAWSVWTLSVVRGQALPSPECEARGQERLHEHMFGDDL
jgi:hypothetical protein